MSKLGALHLSRHTGTKHSATVIFFHGSGSNGADMKEWVSLMVKNFSFPHIKVMYPTAPLQAYTPAGGAMSNVWFDRAGISLSAPEKIDSIAKIKTEVKNIVKQENDAGIPTDRIIVGGFSMGGALALHMGLCWHRNVAGTFVFSSFLNNNSIVYQDLKKSTGVQLPPLLQLHGDGDEMVDFAWGHNTFVELENLGVPGEFHVLPRLGHTINKQGMILIKEFIEKHLPEV